MQETMTSEQGHEAQVQAHRRSYGELEQVTAFTIKSPALKGTADIFRALARFAFSQHHSQAERYEPDESLASFSFSGTVLGGGEKEIGTYDISMPVPVVGKALCDGAFGMKIDIEAVVLEFRESTSKTCAQHYGRAQIDLIAGVMTFISFRHNGG
jgi:hypothetical protein